MDLPTIGYQDDSGFTVFFMGTKTQENVAVYKVPSAPKSEYKPQPLSLNSAMQNMKIMMSELQDKSCKNTQRVKLLCNWASSEQLSRDWEKMSKNGKWTIQDSFKIEVVDTGDIDYYVIINKPPVGEYFDPARTIVFIMEPYAENTFYLNDWLKDIPREKFLYFLDHANFRNNTEWWLNKPLDELIKPIVKNNNMLSTVVSSQYTMKGHRLRIDFIKYFQKHSNHAMDVFGHDNKFDLKNYQGALPLREKNSGIFPYKYHFAAENSDILNYFTEKFNDAIIGESLLFYWGCSNIDEYINPRAYIRLDLDFTEESMKAATQLIEDAIARDEWSSRIDIIRQEKAKIINQFNFYPRVSSLIYASQISFSHLIRLGDSPLSIPGIKVQSSLINQNLKLEDMRKALKYYIHTSIQLPQFGRLADHSNLWRECLDQNKVKCVLETIPKSNFLDHITTILSTDGEWDIIFLNWNPQNHSTEVQNRNLLTPLWQHSLKHINSAIRQGKTVNIIDPGCIGNGYLIHPRGAKKLLDITDKYGFFTPLDEFFFMLHTIIPDFKSLIFEKNLVLSSKIPDTELFHIFYKLADGQHTNISIPFSFPPQPQQERNDILLLSETDIKKRIAKAAD